MKEILAQLDIPEITDYQAVRGGDVNEAYKLETVEDPYFLLIQRNTDEKFYAAEIAGLQLFEDHGIPGPQVLQSSQVEEDAYLLLTYLDEAYSGSQKDLGQLVADLHQIQSPTGKFGFDEPYAGAAIRFSNDWTTTWRDLFIDERMDQLSQALLDQAAWSTNEQKLYQTAREKMIIALEDHDSQPVLLHGDLWAGNYMFLKGGQPVLYDPSPLYGDREFDLGITTVFGGFGHEFYETYQELLPLDPGYSYRLEFYRLYILMIHLLKFGSTYAGPVQESLGKIIQGQ